MTEMVADERTSPNINARDFFLQRLAEIRYRHWLSVHHV